MMKARVLGSSGVAKMHEAGKVQRFEGFDGMRLVAALAVIFSHAFLIASGTEEAEPFVRLFGDRHVAGLYGVFTFFIISGFLLARSLSINPSAINYTVNRVLRIFPAFLFCTLIVAFVVGPLCTSLPVRTYLSSPGVYDYVKFSLDSMGDMTLPGVYEHGGGSVGSIVNGSLWSLRYEALSYVFLLVLWTIFRTSGKAAAAIAAIAALTWVIPAFGGVIPGIAFTLPYFAAGVCMHWVYGRYGTSGGVAIACLVLLAASVIAGIQTYTFALFGAYLIVFAAERPNPGSTIARKIGDCSYGLYLYGWPAEQMVKQVTATTEPLHLFLMTVPVALAFALVSCHLIERPAMRLRSRGAAGVRSIWSVLAPGRPAVLAAEIVFVGGAVLLFLSKTRWWYFLESMGQLLLAATVVAMVASFAGRTIRKVGVEKAVVGAE
jgi:peptidoglycan/LPS O-acetylase OafA/YrhL